MEYEKIIKYSKNCLKYSKDNFRLFLATLSNYLNYIDT